MLPEGWIYFQNGNISEYKKENKSGVIQISQYKKEADHKGVFIGADKILELILKGRKRKLR